MTTWVETLEEADTDMAVGITLEQVAAPGATPITPNQTPEQQFCDNYAKLGVGNISQKDRNTIAILGLIYELAHAGGANYKTIHKQLVQDAMVFTGGISMFNEAVARAANDWNSGNNADATLSTDVPTLLAQGPHIQNQPEQTQERIIAFLRAQLRT